MRQKVRIKGEILKKERKINEFFSPKKTKKEASLLLLQKSRKNEHLSYLFYDSELVPVLVLDIDQKALSQHQLLCFLTKLKDPTWMGPCTLCIAEMAHAL